MTQALPERAELRELLDGLLAEQLNAIQTERLNELLTESEAARREYVLYLSVEGRLAWETAELPPTPSVPSGEPASPEMPKPAPVRLGLLTTEYWRAHPARFATLALTLTLLLWAGVGYVIIPRLNNPTPAQTPATNGVAQLSQLKSPVWAEDARLFAAGDPLAAGDTLKLAAGYAEIKFSDGAVVLLEAPATFTIDTRGAGTLDYGRLTARIEKQATGSEVIPFAISTPLAQVIDQGTAFGIEARESGEVEVEVFDGVVEVMPRSSEAVRRPQSLRLIEGQSASLNPGQDRFVRSEPIPGQFAQTIPIESLAVIAPVGVTSSASHNYAPAERLIDGSGLLEQGHIRQWVHEFREPSASWSTPSQEMPVTLTFDLGQSYDLKSLWVWNLCNRQAAMYRGHNAKEVRVEISENGRDFSTVGDITLAACTQHPARSQSFVLNAQARYVRFIVLSNHDPNTIEVQLSEVRFEVAPQEEN